MSVELSSITGEIQWDIFVVYLIFCVMFIACCCISIACMFLCSPSQNQNQSHAENQAQGKIGRKIEPLQLISQKFFLRILFIQGQSRQTVFFDFDLMGTYYKIVLGFIGYK